MDLTGPKCQKNYTTTYSACQVEKPHYVENGIFCLLTSPEKTKFFYNARKNCDDYHFAKRYNADYNYKKFLRNPNHMSRGQERG